MAGKRYDEKEVQSAILRGSLRVGLQSERARSWGWFEPNEPVLQGDRWSFVAPCGEDHAHLLRSMLFCGAIQLRAAQASDGQCIIAEVAV